jgi:hypothetical protein
MLDIARRGTPAIRAVAGGLNYNPDDNPSHGDPAEMPEQSRPWQRALGAAVLRRIMECSPWLRYCTVVTPVTDAQEGGSLTAGGYLPARETFTLSGSPKVTAYWLTDDFSAPTIPANPTLATADFSSYELVALYTASQEQRLNSHTIAPDGTLAAVPKGESGADPFIARELAEAMARGLGAAIFDGAGSNADPITGLGGRTYTTSLTPTASIVNDVTSALASLRADGRFPSLIAWSPALHKRVRLSTDADGRYVFPPNEAITIDGIPALPVLGIPEGADSFYFVGDFSRVIINWRRLGNGALVQIDRAPTLNMDTWVYRSIARVDCQLAPSTGPASLYKIDSDI